MKMATNKYTNYIFIFFTLLLSTCCGADSAPQTIQPFHQLQYVEVENGLNAQQRTYYYHLSEGIEYIPYDMIMSLKRPKEDGIGLYDESFFSHPERMGLFPDVYNVSNPPIGITVSDNPNYVPMMGINCAACHTTAIKYNNQFFYIDGGQGMLAINRLIRDMIFSMISTLACPSEFEEFYQNYKQRLNISEYPSDFQDYQEILNYSGYSEIENCNPNNFDKLDVALSEYQIEFKDKFDEISRDRIYTSLDQAYPTQTSLDSRTELALYMVKRIKFFLDNASYGTEPENSNLPENGLSRSNPWGSTKNLLSEKIFHKSKNDWLKEFGGPVNTPHIWDYKYQKLIFLAGNTNSMLERNLAQGIALLTDFNWDTYETTISIKQLDKLSKISYKIEPPIWNESILGYIDLDKAKKGKILYQENCLSCHKGEQSQQTGSIEFNYLSVGTDETYLDAQKESFYGSTLFDSLAVFVRQVKYKAASREGIDSLAEFEEGRLPVLWQGPRNNGFEAKPLYGIWATPPYLHNGSIPSIRDLLKKSEDRPKRFYIGNLEYDTNDLGYKQSEVPFSTLVEIDCVKCKGNSNKGHEFGTSLSSIEKDQLIEFLKYYTKDTRF